MTKAKRRQDGPLTPNLQPLDRTKRLTENSFLLNAARPTGGSGSEK